jgi:hypothetical protein|tara:strand:+ start:2071 stop:2940 length:870 start_codon:yes stop_codon:yes gene_type:complete
MNKFLFLLIALFSFEGFADSERHESKEADEDLYGSMCPEEKYGHTSVIVDTTGPLTDAQFTYMVNMVFDESIIESMAPYDRLSILNMTGIDAQASETDYLFSKCRPRNGNKASKHSLDAATFFGAPKAKLQKQTRAFNKRLNSELENLRYQEIDGVKVKKKVGEFTQILEQLKELSRLPNLMFDDAYQDRTLIIVSDLIQYSDKLNLYPSCVKKKQCITWNEFKNKKENKLWIRGIMPKFGDDIPEVKVIYLNSEHDPKLNVGLLEFWNDYFTDLGINFDYEIESSKFE